VLITLEGIDGSGKSTQAEWLHAALGPDAVLVREPGGTEAAERIRELLADPEIQLEPLAELLLFCAARADLVRRVIRPALEAGHDVVCDRFADSTVAYQGVARGLGVELAQSVSDSATEGLRPGITLLLRADPAEGLRRAEGDDRFEREGIELQEKVAAAYEEIAEREPDRVIPIDASGTIEEVHARVMAAVEEARS
jgi:dTMP kinase